MVCEFVCVKLCVKFVYVKLFYVNLCVKLLYVKFVCECVCNILIDVKLFSFSSFCPLPF